MKLLVGVDGSAESEKALAYALDIAEATDGSVTVAYAVDPDVYSAGGDRPVRGLSDADQRLIIESVEDAEDRGIDLLVRAEAFAADRGDDVETELLYGDPVVALAEYASESGFEGIVLGHRGLSERSERVLGSVAKGVLGSATAPVTVVR